MSVSVSAWSQKTRHQLIEALCCQINRYIDRFTLYFIYKYTPMLFFLVSPSYCFITLIQFTELTFHNNLSWRASACHNQIFKKTRETCYMQFKISISSVHIFGDSFGSNICLIKKNCKYFTKGRN